jgi:hypothetical protein
MTSLQNAYLTINPYAGDGMFNQEYLDSLEPHDENEYLRHIRFSDPMTVKIDGRTSRGLICEAGSSCASEGSGESRPAALEHEEESVSARLAAAANPSAADGSGAAISRDIPQAPPGEDQ